MLAALAFLCTTSFAPLPAASRDERDGWIVVHLKGTPAEIGRGHGALLANEISDTIKTLKVTLPADSGKDWSWYRQTSHRLFWSKLEPEYQREIEGIADGAHSKGFAVDADDILAINSYIELSMYYLPVSGGGQGAAADIFPACVGAWPEPLPPAPLSSAGAQERGNRSKAPLACSAFVATGSETKDGRVVMGHDFWWEYVTGERWNVVFDIQPARGHRFMMDSLPGMIESATDWAINDGGIGFCETTIAGYTGFDEKGTPEFMRMRRAIQYSANLDDVVSNLKTGNNGAYANTWLMVDANTNEIGKLELGLRNVTYSHTRDGAYYGANFPENPKLVADEAQGYHNDSVCEDRRRRWEKLLAGSKGKIDVSVAKTFMADTHDDLSGKDDGLGGGALCSKGTSFGDVNAKAVDGAMMKKMEFWGRMGAADGSDILVGTSRGQSSVLASLGELYHDIKGQPWSVIKAD